MDRTMETYMMFAFEGSSRWKSFGSGFRNKSSGFGLAEVIIGILVLAGVITLFLAIIKALQKRDNSIPFRDDRKLFKELCIAHGFDKSDQQIIMIIGNLYRLKSVNKLFVEPHLWNRLKLPPELKKHLPRVKRLQNQLFGSE